MTLEEALQEIERLRASNQDLLRFVIQKCPQCGTVVAPDPAEEWAGVALPGEADG